MANDKLKEIKGRTLISEADLKKASIKFVYYLIFIFLIIGTLTTLLPCFWGFLSALKLPDKIFKIPPTFFPEPFTNPLKWNWKSYYTAFTKIRYMKFFWNTIVLALGVWVFAIFPTALAGYALAKLRMKYGSIFVLLFFATLMVPFEAIFIPLLITVYKLGIKGSYWAIILPAGANAFNIFMFKSFFSEIPTSLMEAARIDGAGEINIFFRIVLPLSRPILAVITIFSFMGTWNDFFWPYLVLDNPDTYPIMVKLYDFQQQAEVRWNEILAALMIASVPPIVLFAFFQKQIMRGITLSGLKF